MSTPNNTKALHISLWIAQGLLAAGFGMAGFMKITAPIDQLAQNGMSFVQEYSSGMVRFIGIAEILGALGVILPAATRIKPLLTPLAALGLALVMVLASVYHLNHSEPITASVVLFLVAVFVAWGRYRMVPVQPKSHKH